MIRFKDRRTRAEKKHKHSFEWCSLETDMDGRWLVLHCPCGKTRPLREDEAVPSP